MARAKKGVKGQVGFSLRCPICTHPEVIKINNMIMRDEVKENGDPYKYTEIADYAAQHPKSKQIFYPSQITRHRQLHIEAGIDKANAMNTYILDMLGESAADARGLDVLTNNIALKSLELLMSVDEKAMDGMTPIERLEYAQKLADTVIKLDEISRPQRDALHDVYNKFLSLAGGDKNKELLIQNAFATAFPDKKLAN